MLVRSPTASNPLVRSDEVSSKEGDADRLDFGRAVVVKAGEAKAISRNPVRGGSGSGTSFNPAGVGSFEPRERPNRIDRSGDLGNPGGEKLNHERPARACR